MNEGGLLGGLFSDSDTLLILGLCYILYKQDADKKLILALLSILIA